MVQPGEVIFEAGAKAEAVFQVAMGTVRVEAAAGSRLLRPEDLPGGFLGLEPYLRGGNHGATARAEETCFLAVIGADRREAFLRTHPALAFQALGF